MQDNVKNNHLQLDRQEGLYADLLESQLTDSHLPSETSLVEKIKGIAAPYLSSLGLDLFDIQLSGTQVRIFIDKTGGVTLDDCAKFSRLLSPALDVSDCISSHYTLEVSSPGLDRPLLKKEDYLRFTGGRVKIKTSVKIMDQKVFTGRLSDFNGEEIFLVTDEGREFKIPFSLVLKAHLEIEFPPEQKRRN